MITLTILILTLYGLFPTRPPEGTGYYLDTYDLTIAVSVILDVISLTVLAHFYW